MGRKARLKKERREGGQAKVATAPAEQEQTTRPIHVTDANFDATVLGSEVPVLVDFWAPWCGPCKMIGPILEAYAEEMDGAVKVVKYNTQQSKRVAQKMGIRSIPTLVLFKDGEVADVHIGAQSANRLRSWVDKTLNPKPSLLKRLFGGQQASPSA